MATGASDAPGVRRKLTPADMPAPLASQPAANPSRVVAPARRRAAQGAARLHRQPIRNRTSTQPRVVRIAPNGDIFVAESDAGRVRALRADDSLSAPAESEIFAAGLNRPFGIAFYPPGPNPAYVYVATNTQVVRYPYRNGDLNASGPPEIDRRRPCPAGAAIGRATSSFRPTARRCSSRSARAPMSPKKWRRLPAANCASFEASHPPGAAWGAEENRADVLAFDPDGRNMRVFATGIRNCSGLPSSRKARALWCAVNERDMLGDDLPPDYATRVREGGFYGWPWYVHRRAMKTRATRASAPIWPSKIAMPDVLIQPHSAPLGIAFYEAAQFPAGLQGRRFRRAAWLVEPRQANRLQGRAPAVQGRQADRRI